MKHGRRHDSLKEKAYLARKDAEGYGKPYRAIDVAEPPRAPPPPPQTDVPLGLALGNRAKRAMRRAGIDPDE